MKDHVRVRSTAGRVSLAVDDYELYDFLEDYFTERLELKPSWVEHREADRHWALTFPAEVGLEQVESALDPRELERIWRVNDTP